MLVLLIVAVQLAVAVAGLTRVDGEMQMAPPGIVQDLVYPAACLICFVVQTLALGAFTAAVADRCADRPTGLVRAYRRSWCLFWRNALTWLLCLLIVMTGGMLLVVPGLVALVYLSVAGPAVIVERLGPVEAVRRSYGLVRGRFWHVVALGLVAVLLLLALRVGLGLVAWALGQVLTLLGAGAGMFLGLLGLPTMLLEFLLMPLFFVLPVLLYLDLRARKEGFDRATLAAELVQTGTKP